MADTPNLFTSFRGQDPGETPIEPGDVALLLKKNGAVQALTFGYDRTRLLRPEAELSDDDKVMVHQGEKLFALALAASNEGLMQALLELAADPSVVDREKLAAAMRLH